jgi:hypothetical protein
MTEALLAVPVLTLLAIAILELGVLFLERQAVQTGVRDAARYLARCLPDTGRCSVAVARNIAFHGTLDGSGPLRLRGWSGEGGLVLVSALPPTDGILRVEGRFDHGGSPLVGVLDLPALSITYPHAERWMGW